jgi:hypothetical protein
MLLYFDRDDILVRIHNTGCLYYQRIHSFDDLMLFFPGEGQGSEDAPLRGQSPPR